MEFRHWLHVDTEAGTVIYDRNCPATATVQRDYRLRFDVARNGKSLLPEPMIATATAKTTLRLPDMVKMQPGDEVVTSLQVQDGDAWSQVGSETHYRLREGAPFTFGRALGLGTEPVAHGTQLYLDGVAIFNRVLNHEELRGLSFGDR
jgi:hypothetical protein